MKPTIEDIKVNEKELNIHLAQKSGHVNRKEFIRKHTCNSCNQWATKLIEYQVGDKDQKATRIERYCQKHFELIIKKKEDVFYKKKIMRDLE
jgi:hypothetical protein